MRYHYLCSWLLVILPFCGFSQGKLLLVGGGREDYGSWSDTPYQWAIEQAENKKVAIIGYEAGTDWYKDYFMSLGAVQATAITLGSRQQADLLETYQALMESDLLFFRGGDQNRYYTYFKGTRTQQAIIDKYAAGGVIGGTSAGMAILSQILYTAENGSLYPDEALQNLQHEKVTLASDFLPFYPNHIFDTHFLERARLPRLLAFMANWEQQSGQTPSGIGVDDKTAFGIDANGIGTAWGTGAVSLYRAGSYTSNSSGRWAAQDIELTQLRHGMQANLLTGEPLSELPLLLDESDAIRWHNPVLISGGTAVSSTASMLRHLLQQTGSSTDSILLVSANETSLALSYKQLLESEGTAVVSVLHTNAANNQENSTEAIALITSAKKIMLLNPSFWQLSSFIKAGPAGNALRKRWLYPAVVLAFNGSSSHYAGEVFSTNYLVDPAAAYTGNLQYQKGLSLLNSTYIVPEAFAYSQADFQENQLASVHYAMAKDSLRWGLMLTSGSYIKLWQENNQNKLAAYDEPVLLFQNTLGKASAAETGRNVAAFEQLLIHLLPLQEALVVGTPQAPELEQEQPEVPTGFGDNRPEDSLRIRSTSYGWQLLWPTKEYKIKLLTLNGRLLLEQKTYQQAELRVTALPRGLYLLHLTDNYGNVTVKKLVYTGSNTP